MSRMKSILRPDALLFIALAAVFWLVMTVSNADTARVVNVTVVSDQRIVDDLWLLDTTATLQVRVAAQGINILGLRKLNSTVLTIPSEFWNTEQGSARVKGSDLLASISDAFGNSAVQVIDEYITFPSTEVVTKLQPVRVDGSDRLTLPSGWNWLEKPHIEPLVIEVRGPNTLLSSATPFITIAPREWEGAMGLSYEVSGLPYGCTTSSDEIILLGHSAVWAERKITIEIQEGSRVYPVEVWLSGPAEELKRTNVETLGTLELDRKQEHVLIDFKPGSKNLKVLRVSPSDYPIFTF